MHKFLSTKKDMIHTSNSISDMQERDENRQGLNILLNMTREERSQLSGEEKQKYLQMIDAEIIYWTKKLEDMEKAPSSKQKAIIDWVKNHLIAIMIASSTLGVGAGIYGLSKVEKVQEAIESLKEEGIGPTVEQFENRWNQEKESEQAIYLESDTIVDSERVQDSLPPPPGPSKISNQKNKTIKGADFRIKIIGDTITKDNYIYTPCIINLDQEDRRNYRNRGETRDLKNTDGAMVSAFRPFVPPPQFQNDLSSSRDNATVIALNNKTGKISVGFFKEFKDSTDYLVSETWRAREVASINVGHNNGYLQNIYQKGLILVDTLGGISDYQIGIGKSESGNELLGYSGGKIMIYTPDKAHGRFVYGTANQLRDRLEEFKKVYGVKYVLRYDLDQKSYSQTVQTKNKTISGAELIALDNFNSAASKSGNVLYLDNERGEYKRPKKIPYARKQDSENPDLTPKFDFLNRGEKDTTVNK